MLRERVELEMIPNLTHFITMYEDIFFMKYFSARKQGTGKSDPTVAVPDFPGFFPDKNENFIF